MVINRSFDDFDALCELVQGWSVRLRQLERGRFHGDLQQAQVGTSLLTHARLGLRLEQGGAPPPGRWTFALPGGDCPPFVWRGEQVEPGDLIVYGPETEIECVAPGGFRILTFSVPESRVVEAAEAWGDASQAETLVAGVLHRVSAKPLRRITRVLEHLALQLTDGPETPEAGAGREAEFLLLSRILEVVASHRGSGPRASDRFRDRILKRIESFLAEREQEPVSLEMLCSATDASPRTLHRAFRERYGVSPAHYLKARRLNGVRAELRNADPAAASVQRVALRWGFWHLGQFSADYRRHFGELPSATLRGLGAGGEAAPGI